jgi:uncharacterized protein
MTYLPDVNFWLALTFQSHQNHQSASSWFGALKRGDTCLFCRMTQQGFLRLATNPQAFGAEAVTLDVAWTLYDALLSDSCVGFVPEPPGIEPRWRTFSSPRTFSPKLWNDAYLAAFAVVANCELATFDKAFTQYSGLTVHQLA